MAEALPEIRTKVFVSYARTDKAFANDLVLGLAACGFAPYIDREDIAAGEDWSKRLSGLIAEADTIVYVISPDSLTSEHCSWELAESLRLAKRVLPVVWRPVDDAAAPAELKRLNYIFFSGDGRTFATGLSQLAEALRTDISWIREHTRIGGLAQRWIARNRSEALLLRGDDLDAATEWMAAKPMGAPAITDEQADFVKASSNARAEAERRARTAKAGMLTAVSVAALVFAGLAGAAAWQWQSAARAEGEARLRRDEAIEANRSLEAANIRLSANIGLRTAPSSSYLDVAGGWFPVAANYSGAVARVERRGGDGTVYTVGSGLLIDGGLVNSKLAGEPLLLTPLIQGQDYEGPNPGSLALAEGEGVDFSDPNLGRLPQTRISNSGPWPADVKVHFSLPVSNAEQWVATGELVWSTPDHLGGVTPFEIWRPAGALPAGSRPIVETDIDCSDPYGLVAADRPGAGSDGWAATFGVDAGGSSYAGERTATLYISRLITRDDPYAMRYDHATNIGAAGGPVFDLGSGKIFAIHVGSDQDAARPGRRVGIGISLPMVLTGAREASQPREGRLGLMCGLE